MFVGGRVEAREPPTHVNATFCLGVRRGPTDLSGLGPWGYSNHMHPPAQLSRDSSVFWFLPIPQLVPWLNFTTLNQR
jgi:hypothetical protein